MTEHGAILVDGIQQGSTNRCPHCGGHFLVAQSGSLKMAKESLGDMAKPRAYCKRCDRLTCGRAGCDPSFCVPLEARLEHVEGTPTRYDEAIRQIEEKGLVIL